MNKSFIVITIFLLIAAASESWASTPSRIVEEYNIGNKTYCLVDRAGFYDLVEKEADQAWENFWTSSNFLKYKANARRMIPDAVKIRITGFADNKELEQLVRSIYTDGEIVQYANSSKVELYILCDYVGKIIRVSMNLGMGSKERLNPCVGNVPKFARLVEEIEKRWSVELFYKENPEPCYQIYVGDIFHFKLFPDWIYKPFDQRPALFTLPELQ